MRRRIITLALAAAFLALAACGLAGRKVTVWRAVSQYYLESGSAVQSEPVSVNASLSEIEAAVEAFNSDTTDAELIRALPEGVDITGWELNGTELCLSVSPEYASVTGYWRTVADCCMVLTFCAIDGVESVSVYSEGVMLTAAMTTENIVLTDASAD